MTFGQRRAASLRLSRRRYSSGLTRRGLRRHTPLIKSATPPAAAVNTSRPSRSSLTATAVAVSGHVATPSAEERKGGSSNPKRCGYQMCTAAWFFASQATAGCAARSDRTTSSSR